MTKHAPFFSSAIKSSDSIPLRKMRSFPKTILQKGGLYALMDIPSSAREPITTGNAHNSIVSASACHVQWEEQPAANTFIPTRNRGIPFTPVLSKAWESLVRFTAGTKDSKAFIV